MKAIDFYKQVFDATETMRLQGADGRIGHAELKIGDAHIMLADEFPEMDIRGPKSFGGTGLTLMVYVADVDATFAKAVAAGSEVKRPVQNQFYGDRSGMIIDPFGHAWAISTHVEDVTPEEINRRAAEFGNKDCTDSSQP